LIATSLRGNNKLLKECCSDVATLLDLKPCCDPAGIKSQISAGH
jgi:hypothetical protein